MNLGFKAGDRFFTKLLVIFFGGWRGGV